MDDDGAARTMSTVRWEALTPTERRVAELVARGLTNPEIGRRLRIATTTVKTHMEHVFLKLDVHSRAQVAAEQARHGE